MWRRLGLSLLVIVIFLGCMPSTLYRLIVEVAPDQIIAEAANNRNDSVLQAALIQARSTFSKSKTNFARHFQKVYHQLYPQGRLTDAFTDLVMAKRPGVKVSEKVVIVLLEEQLKQATQKALNVLQQRLLNYDIKGAQLKIVEGSTQIELKVPGVAYPSRLKRVLLKVGKLEFWRVYDLKECYEGVMTLAKGLNTKTKTVLNIKRNRLIVQVSDTAIVNQVLKNETYRKGFPAHTMFLWQHKPNKTGELWLYMIKGNAQKKAPLSGETLATVKGQMSNYNQPCVTFSLNSEGAGKWAKLTRENLLKRIAISLDGKVLLAALVQSEITSGRGEISGNYTLEETKQLAQLLKTGALPTSLRLVLEDVVGPTKSKD
ncbi:MAG TPA: hypothetical protein DCS93_12570 [Microscillaceae bacterium]|nr:hypothetical protein [Microscillaceae bacterium]